MGKSKIFTLFFIFLLSFANFGLVKAQEVELDTTQHIVAKPMVEKEPHSPRQATIYSAILPGLGQAYNKKYWKIPLIYIGFGTIGYFMDWNNDNYRFLQKAYIDLVDNDASTNSYLEIPAAKNYDLDNATRLNSFKEALIKQQEYYRRNRDLLFISMFGFYGLNLIDASVDAHFFDFDISEDLTLKWQPSMMYLDKQTIFCVNCTINF